MHNQLVRYDSNSRHREIVKNFEDKLTAAEKNLRKKYGSSNSSPAASSSEKEFGGDLVKMQLEQLSQQVKQFEEDVDKFSSPYLHFTKEYRALTTQSRELMVCLDRIKIDATQRQDDLNRKKHLICAVVGAVANLKSKVHDDGQLCKGCKVTFI